jgi:hypothetical protein
MAMARQGMLAACAAGLLVAACPTPVTAQWQIDSKDGKTNIKVGFLAQPQLETIDTPNGSGTSTNLFLRRFRILFGGKLSDKWMFFFETDSPNLGKANAAGVKDAGSVFMQDAFVTYTRSGSFLVDVGLMLPALGRNHTQSAATLLPVDYGPYSCLESGPVGERVARDYGVQVRGYPGKQRFEYRLGVFQGVRGVDARNTLRVVGRGVWYPVGAETGFFYAGTFQGSKRVVAIGASVDRQKDYGVYGVDAFLEQPIHKGQQGVTLQGNWMRYDGAKLLTTLPKQDVYLVEAGVHLGKGKFSPFLQLAGRHFDNPLTPDQNSFQVGIAWWMAGHNRNLKLSAGRQHAHGQPDRVQVLGQLQVYAY